MSAKVLAFKNTNKRTGNPTNLFGKKEVVDFWKVNYKNSCLLNNSEHWNCKPEYRAVNNKDGSSQICYVHGWHTYAGRGEYVLTRYENIDARLKSNKDESLSAEEKEANAREFFKGSDKDWLSIRDHDGHEWHFECPADLVHMVEYMLSHNLYWIKYVIKNGLTRDMAIHLAYRYTVTAETNSKIYQIEEAYGEEANGICYKREPDKHFKGHWNYFFDDKTNRFAPNPLYTPEQINCLVNIALDNARKAIRAVELKHQQQIAQQDAEGK